MTFSQALWALGAIAAIQGVTALTVVEFGRREHSLARGLPFLVSGAAGVLLATACLDLLPEGIRLAGNTSAFWGALLGSLLALFCLQTGAHALAHAEAGHHEEHGHPDQPVTPVTPSGASVKTSRPGRHRVVPLLFGSALHSAVDGVAITAAFAAGRGAGWGAAIAVGLHELPHRVSDFSLLLHSGVSRKLAVQLAVLAGGAALLGGLAVVVLGHQATAAPWLLPVSAATFLYIALVDLLPEIHARLQNRRTFGEIACLFAGAALMALASSMLKE